MFYYVEFTEENVLNYKQRIDDLNELEICYNTDPRQLVLVAKQLYYIRIILLLSGADSHLLQQRILGDPTISEEESLKIETKAQLEHFVDAVFFPEDPGNSILYEQQDLGIGDIHQAIQRYEILDYARKSRGTEPVEKRAQLLNKMAVNLRERDHDRVKDHKMFKRLENVGGSMQDTIPYIQSMEKGFCLATIDSAGLTSNP
ncbi:hypothetical protein DFQ30_001523 [Apophysomyces sp. BC1015]|nr:hypothetical protein DFQ30_001523 [Apophysomyces sp. BC1015]